MSTCFQRTCTSGPYVPRECQQEYRYEALVEQSAHRITGFCYNDKGGLPSSQAKIGVTYEEKPMGPLSNPPFQAAYTLPNSRIPQWFVSSACLAGALHVRLFVDTKQPHTPTMGMLLTYGNRQESLGQCRFDCDVEDYDLTGPIYFSSGETEFGPYTNITCNSVKEQGWREIPPTAKLVWWFTATCSQLDVSII